MIDYKVIPPPPDLKDVISHFWVGTWDAQSQQGNSMYYIVASSLMEITFAFKDHHHRPELLFSTVQGQANQPAQFSVEGYSQLLGVSLYAHAVPGLFNIPAAELNNQFLTLNTFLGHEGDILAERIALAKTTLERIGILANYFKSLLYKRQDKDQRIVKAIEYIRQQRGNAKVAELCKEFNLSQKQFERRFRDFSGFNPKMYARIVRFETAVNNYSGSGNLTELAYNSGYYDQAHFIHDMQAFTGFSPRDFFKLSEG
ncbi:MAG TPA: AraC family transcriptional regulator [Flavipsychrobacter sp.]